MIEVKDIRQVVLETLSSKDAIKISNIDHATIYKASSPTDPEKIQVRVQSAYLGFTVFALEYKPPTLAKFYDIGGKRLNRAVDEITDHIAKLLNVEIKGETKNDN